MCRKKEEEKMSFLTDIHKYETKKNMTCYI